MKFKNSLWGLLLIGGAAILILSGLGYMPAIGFWKLVWTVFFVFLLIGGIKELSWPGMLFPLAFLGIVWSDQLGINAITPWPILGAALLASIGCSLIFTRKHGWKCTVHNDDIHFSNHGKKDWNKDWNRDEDEDNDPGYTREYSSFQEMKEDLHTSSESSEEGNEFHSSLVFGTNIRYIDSISFERADLELVFSTEKIYFDKAHLNNGRATIYLDGGVFSTLELYVPKDWRVDCNCERVGGSYRGYGKSVGNEQILTLEGDAVFSSIKVFYI